MRARTVVLLISMSFLSCLQAAELVHQWSFNGSLKDAVGGADATIQGSGGDAVLDSEKVTLRGGARASTQYIQLPDGVLSSTGDQVTLEIWATQISVQNWSRIFDFGANTAENLFMSWTMGTGLSSDRVEWHGTENDTVDNTNGPYTLGVQYHIVMVVDDETVSWYTAPSDAAVLGEVQGSFTTANRISTLNDNNCWLGRSQYGDNNANASYDECRIWRGVLTAQELQTTHELGPDGLHLELAQLIAPGIGEEDVELDVVLQWAPGIYAGSHDLYVGTDFDDVNEADRDDPRDVFMAQGLGLDDTSYVFDEMLELDRIYYWRVDEVNATPDAHIFKGKLWNFSSEPTYLNPTPVAVSASSYDETEDYNCPPENTINGSGLIEGQHSKQANAMWRTMKGEIEGAWIQYEFDCLYQFERMHVWNYNGENEAYLGVGAKDVVIKTSLDGIAWTSTDQQQLTRATGTPTYRGEDVDMNDVVARYVRIEIQSQHSFPGGAIVVNKVGLSEVHFYVVPIAARRPTPESGNTLGSVFDQLVWRSGRGAELHRVYLSTDANAVATGAPNVLAATVTNDRRLDLSDIDLVYAHKYYWRVDEVASTQVIAGPLWDFNTPDFYSIDDMESYNKDVIIWNSWSDGYGNNNDNGSEIGNTQSPYVEQFIAFGGSQSMPMKYDNTHGEQAAWATLPVETKIFNAGGVQQLSVMFKSTRTNTGGQFYVEINGVRVTSPTSLTSGLWTQLIANLSEFGNLSKANTLKVGVAGNGKKGLIYIDDIALYPVAPILAVAQSSNPGSNALEMQLKMESNLQDSSGKNRHATAPTTVFYSKSLVEGSLNLGKALSLDGVSEFVNMNPVGTLLPSLGDSTFAIWANIDDESEANYGRAFDLGNDDTTYLFLTPRAGTTSGGARVAITLDGIPGESTVGSDKTLTGWHHLAVVIDAGAADPNGTLTLYVDGVSAGTVETDTLPQNLGITTNNWLGRSQYAVDDYFEGLLDEFVIYSRALSEAEIRWLAGDR